MLGVFIVNGPEKLDTLRIPGVLQRFAWSFLINGGVILLGRKMKLNKISSLIFQWTVMASLIATYACLTFFLPVPNCPVGYIGPGGLQDPEGVWNDSPFFIGESNTTNLPLVNCAGGSAGYIDNKILGPEHIYNYPTLRNLYYDKRVFGIDNAVPYDPEGILGILGSVMIVFFGMHVTKILQHFTGPKTGVKEQMKVIYSYISVGLVLCAIAAGLNGFSQEGGVIPVNKNLWSISFVTLLSGFGFLVLGFLFYVQDVKKLWDGRPFFFMGMNSMFVYLGHDLLG